LHTRVARVLEQHFAHLTERQPEMLEGFDTPDLKKAKALLDELDA
jgi:hypothetical protein